MAKPTTTTTKKTMATKSAPKNGATAPVEKIAPVPTPQAAPSPATVPAPAPAPEAAPRRAVKAAKVPTPAKTAKAPGLAKVAKPRGVAPKAVAAKRTAKPKAKAKKASYTLDDVALRAYFIAQDRHAKGIPGSPENDWLEAERQLRAEVGL